MMPQVKECILLLFQPSLRALITMTSDKGARIYSATEEEWVREHLGTLEGLKLPGPASIHCMVLKGG